MKSFKIAAACLPLILLAACAQGPVHQDETVFYPPLPQTPRVQFLTGFTTEDEFAGRSNRFRDFLLGGDTDESKSLARPFSIAHRPGEIIIADKTYHTIVFVDLEAREFNALSEVAGRMMLDPVSVFITPNGELLVADSQRNQVFVFNERNEYVGEYGDGTTFRPLDAVVYGDRVYVADLNASEVEVLDRATGEVIDVISSIGSADGQLNKPTHLALDAAGNLFVTDSFNLRLQMFDPQGEFVKVIGWNVRGPGGLARPKGLDVDRDGHLYIADVAFQVIQIFSVETRDALLYFGKAGQGPGGNHMPSDVHIDYDNVKYFQEFAHPQFEIEYLIYVGNLLGDKRLNVYGFGRWTGDSEDSAPAPPGAGDGESVDPSSTAPGTG